MLRKISAVIKYISFFCLFLSFFFAAGCKDKKETNSSIDVNNPALVWILKGNYKTVQSFHALPTEVQLAMCPGPLGLFSDDEAKLLKNELSKEDANKIMERRAKLPCRMADRGEPFNETDMVTANLPFQRFITGGFSDKQAFVFYEVGGYAPYNELVVVVFSKNNENFEIVFDGICGHSTMSLRKLKSSIRSGNLK
jgi:hypothetical protein